MHTKIQSIHVYPTFHNFLSQSFPLGPTAAEKRWKFRIFAAFEEGWMPHPKARLTEMLLAKPRPWKNTVDGSKIRPAAVEGWDPLKSHYLQGFIHHPRRLFGISTFGIISDRRRTPVVRWQGIFFFTDSKSCTSDFSRTSWKKQFFAIWFFLETADKVQKKRYHESGKYQINRNPILQTTISCSVTSHHIIWPKRDEHSICPTPYHAGTQATSCSSRGNKCISNETRLAKRNANEPQKSGFVSDKFPTDLWTRLTRSLRKHLKFRFYGGIYITCDVPVFFSSGDLQILCQGLLHLKRPYPWKKTGFKDPGANQWRFRFDTFPSDFPAKWGSLCIGSNILH